MNAHPRVLAVRFFAALPVMAWSACAVGGVVTVNFAKFPGPDGVLNTPDDQPVPVSDITTFGGTRVIDDEYLSLGLRISGTAGPRLALLGGGLDSDEFLGPDTNIMLSSVGDNGVAPFSVLFDLDQDSITLDLAAIINSSGTSMPVQFRRDGALVGSQTLTDADALIDSEPGSDRVSGRFVLNPGTAFDEVAFSLSGPSGGGFFIDNLRFMAVPGPSALPVLVAAAAAVSRRRR